MCLGQPEQREATRVVGEPVDRVGGRHRHVYEILGRTAVRRRQHVDGTPSDGHPGRIDDGAGDEQRQGAEHHVSETRRLAVFEHGDQVREARHRPTGIATPRANLHLASRQLRVWMDGESSRRIDGSSERHLTRFLDHEPLDHFARPR